MKSLELEVAELRKRNAVLETGTVDHLLALDGNSAEVDELTNMGDLESAASQDLICQLQETLASKDIPASSSRTPGSQPGIDMATCSMGGTTFPNQSLQVRYPPVEPSVEPGRESDLAKPDAIVNFVLSLEQPCLYHHRLPSPELIATGSFGATGHSSMLSNVVVDRAPSFSLNPLAFGYPPNAEWQTPTAELETLLQMSQQLGLDTEITPVQVWSHVKQHPKFGFFTVAHLEILRARLLPLVKCHG